jgi:hypothetical protein
MLTREAVKLIDPRTRLQCDLNVNEQFGLHNSRLLRVCVVCTASCSYLAADAHARRTSTSPRTRGRSSPPLSGGPRRVD